MLRKSKTKPSDGDGLLSPAQTPGFESRPALGSLSPGNAAACRARARGPGAPWSPAFAFLPRPRARCRGGGTPEPGPATCSPAPLGPRASPEPGSLPGRLPFDPAEAGKTGSPGTGPEAGNLTLKPAGGRGALPAASEAQEACGVPSAGAPWSHSLSSVVVSPGYLSRVSTGWSPETQGRCPLCPCPLLPAPVSHPPPPPSLCHLLSHCPSFGLQGAFLPSKARLCSSGLALRIGSHITGSYCHLSKFDTLLLCSPAAGASFRRPGIGHCSSQVPNLHLRAKRKHLSYLTLEKRRVVWTFQQQESLSQMWLPPLRFSEVWLHEKWALDDFRT